MANNNKDNETKQAAAPLPPVEGVPEAGAAVAPVMPWQQPTPAPAVVPARVAAHLPESEGGDSWGAMEAPTLYVNRRVKIDGVHYYPVNHRGVIPRPVAPEHIATLAADGLIDRPQ